ncbi:unnamed protein product [Pleuronectes platessa]|uniref:Uncharacterized protein n=1 Tax=Pleuronectes platessa TaxID=8262 RepID=A0A9N7TLP8_PLEPL|nr:unnamed protein product [Pleuronectes platessa]
MPLTALHSPLKSRSNFPIKQVAAALWVDGNGNSVRQTEVVCPQCQLQPTVRQDVPARYAVRAVFDSSTSTKLCKSIRPFRQHTLPLAQPRAPMGVVGVGGVVVVPPRPPHSAPAS